MLPLLILLFVFLLAADVYERCPCCCLMLFMLFMTMVLLALL